MLTSWILGILDSAYSLISQLKVQFFISGAFFSSFDQKFLEGQYFDAVDLVETAFNKLADNVVSAYVQTLADIILFSYMQFKKQIGPLNIWNAQLKEFLVITWMVVGKLLLTTIFIS